MVPPLHNSAQFRNVWNIFSENKKLRHYKKKILRRFEVSYENVISYINLRPFQRVSVSDCWKYLQKLL